MTELHRSLHAWQPWCLTASSFGRHRRCPLVLVHQKYHLFVSFRIQLLYLYSINRNKQAQCNVLVGWFVWMQVASARLRIPRLRRLCRTRPGWPSKVWLTATLRRAASLLVAHRPLVCRATITSRTISAFSAPRRIQQPFPTLPRITMILWKRPLADAVCNNFQFLKLAFVTTWLKSLKHQYGCLIQNK